VVADGAEATLEVLGEAVELARPGRPGVVAVGPPARWTARLAGCAGRGAGRLVLLHAGEEPAPAAAARALAAWLAAAGSAAPAPIVLLPHTARGREVAAHVAVRLDAAVAPDALAVRRAPGGHLEVVRPAYGDRLHATVRIDPGAPAVVTLRPGVLGPGPLAPGPTVPVEEIPAPAGEPGAGARVRRTLEPDPRTVDLAEAERIVAGGRGVGGPEGFQLLQELADLLGAAVGGSRVAVDLGWLPWERQVGQSGRLVAPRLYLALGISGASQHLAGCRDASTVVAVNADPTAPILERADLAAVADWRPVVQALIARLRARRAAPPAAGG
jgi:electron transfer flavoprotein alpha subunit